MDTDTWQSKEKNKYILKWLSEGMDPIIEKNAIQEATEKRLETLLLILNKEKNKDLQIQT